MEEYLYTVDEVASILKVNKNTVYDLIKNGNLIALKLGRLKVTKVMLLKFLKDFNGKDLTDLNNIKDLTF
ncbi:DNA-binding protein [Clostridium botulinum]|nr:DNA-binding protein [Clostridium botulinum]NFF10944.1 DNA-binding protein [Clostridium botulinum]